MEASQPRDRRLADLLARQQARPPAYEEQVAPFPDFPRPGSFRLVVDLPVAVVPMLDGLAERRGAGHADVVGQSVATLKYIDDALAAGADMFIRTPGGRTRRLVPSDQSRPWVDLEQAPSHPAPRRRWRFFRRSEA